MAKKIVIVGSQHGNEPLGELLKEHMKSYDIIPGVHFITANPRAIQAGKRYIETDMNRSFDRLDTYEGRRASALRRLLWLYKARLSTRYAHY
ncbi:MAG: succinylglutamate desuccinylase/aspartoacylase family protein [Candidatus Saccharimonadales bacterium]